MKCLKPWISRDRLAFPCGNCAACRSNRRRIWMHRIILESMQWPENSFVTLTYEDSKVPRNTRGICTLNAEHLSLWLKRLRKKVHPLRVRYYAVGEYSEIGRPHYHAAIFNLGCKLWPRSANGLSCNCLACSSVRETWDGGHSLVGTLTERSAAYIAGYVTKKMQKSFGSDGLRASEFARMSLSPGIGADAVPDVASVLMRYRSTIGADVPSVLRHGVRMMPLGRYLRGKLREGVGLERGCPPEVLEALRQGLLPVFERAEELASQSTKYRYGEASFPHLAFAEANSQVNANIAARNQRKEKL